MLLRELKLYQTQNIPLNGKEHINITTNSFHTFKP